MGFLDALKGLASGLKEKFGIGGAGEYIKEKILGKATAPGPTPPEGQAPYLEYLDKWREAGYRSYVTPKGYVEEGEVAPVLGREFYAEGPEGMESNYQTFFMGYGTDRETGEFAAQPFTVSHDDLLYEEDLEDVIEEFTGLSGDIDYDQIDPISGLTSLGEVYA